MPLFIGLFNSVAFFSSNEAARAFIFSYLPSFVSLAPLNITEKNEDVVEDELSSAIKNHSRAFSETARSSVSVRSIATTVSLSPIYQSSRYNTKADENNEFRNSDNSDNL